MDLTDDVIVWVLGVLKIIIMGEENVKFDPYYWLPDRGE